ncbi:MAG: DUF6056 family protein [Enterococcus faecalis]
MKVKLNKKKIFICSIIITFLVMLTLNNLTPLLADDYEYLYKTKSWMTILIDEYNQSHDMDRTFSGPYNCKNIFIVTKRNF